MKLWALLLVLVSCSSPTYLTPGAVQIIDPPLVISENYKATARCVGHVGYYDKVRWFVADSLVYDGRKVNGFWLPPHDIYFNRSTYHSALIYHWYGVWVIKHETIHDLTQGRAKHDDQVFKRCAPLERAGTDVREIR